MCTETRMSEGRDQPGRGVFAAEDTARAKVRRQERARSGRGSSWKAGQGQGLQKGRLERCPRGGRWVWGLERAGGGAVTSPQPRKRASCPARLSPEPG